MGALMAGKMIKPMMQRAAEAKAAGAKDMAAGTMAGAAAANQNETKKRAARGVATSLLGGGLIGRL